MQDASWLRADYEIKIITETPMDMASKLRYILGSYVAKMGYINVFVLGN